MISLEEYANGQASGLLNRDRLKNGCGFDSHLLRQHPHLSTKVSTGILAECLSNIKEIQTPLALFAKSQSTEDPLK